MIKGQIEKANKPGESEKEKLRIKTITRQIKKGEMGRNFGSNEIHDECDE